MANATWDEPVAAAPAAAKRKKQNSQRSLSFKSLPSQISNKFKSEKGSIDRLLTLLRTSSFCGKAPPKDECDIPKSIICGGRTEQEKRPNRSLDERIKSLSMSDSMTSMSSSLSDQSLVSLDSVDQGRETETCAARQLSLEWLRPVEKSEMARIQSVQTA